MERTTTVNRILAWVPALVWMAIIFSLSNRQRVSVSQEYVLNFIFFKTLHVLEYAMLFILVSKALWGSLMERAKQRIFVHAFVITVLYALTDELHQLMVPTREGTLRDVIIDAAGAGLAWYYLSTQLPRAPKKLKTWAKSLGLPT
jgi:VanZ family protein